MFAANFLHKRRRMKNTLLHSRRILFRNFTEEDKNKDLEIFAHKKLEYFTEEPIEDADLFIDKIIEAYENENDFYFYHLVKVGQGKSLGMAKVDIDGKNARIKVLINESVKNRGYGTEALETLIHEVFTEGLASRVEVLAQKDNGAWIEVIKKSHLEKYHEDEDYIYYQMTNLDYMKYFAIFGEIDI